MASSRRVALLSPPCLSGPGAQTREAHGCRDRPGLGPEDTARKADGAPAARASTASQGAKEDTWTHTQRFSSSGEGRRFPRRPGSTSVVTPRWSDHEHHPQVAAPGSVSPV